MASNVLPSSRSLQLLFGSSELSSRPVHFLDTAKWSALRSRRCKEAHSQFSFLRAVRLKSAPLSDSPALYHVTAVRPVRRIAKASGARKAVPADELTSPSSDTAAPVDSELESILTNVRTAVGLLEEYNASVEEYFVASGWEELGGMQGKWTLMWGTDGRFWEQFWGKEVSYHCAFDGNATWQADPGGCCWKSDLDDREASLLASWIRTGVWLLPAAKDWLEIRLAKRSELDSGGPDFKLTKQQAALRVKLWDGVVEAFVVVEREEWLPTRVALKVYSAVELWIFRDWLRYFPERDWRYPSSITRVPKSGAVVEATVTAIQASTKSALDAACQMPPNRMLTPPTAVSPEPMYHQQVSPFLEVSQAGSGHLVVRPLLDGLDVGYFLLDSGASSLTLSPKVADQLQMAKFGETFATGVEGTVSCSYRRGGSFSLGPLQIKNPIFLELESGNVAKGVQGVVGICGFDIFFHCVVEIHHTEKGVQVALYEPVNYQPCFPGPLNWQALRMMGNVPHMSARIQVSNRGRGAHRLGAASKEPAGVEVLLMVDTGAAGVGALLYSRAARDLGLTEADYTGGGTIQGMGSTAGLEVNMATLASMEIGGQKFRNVNVLFLPDETAGGIDLSKWTAGILCSDLLSKCIAVYDYSRNRMVLVNVDALPSKL